MAATMRDHCQLSRRCDSYDSYMRGYCSNNPSENPGWSFNSYNLAEQVLMTLCGEIVYNMFAHSGIDVASQLLLEYRI